MQGVLHHTIYCYCSNKLKLLYVFSQSESSSLNVVFLDLGPGFFLKNSEILMLSLLSFFDLGPGLDFFFSSFFGISIEMSSSSELSYLITFLTSVSGSTFRFFDLGPALDEPVAEEFTVLISVLISVL